MKEVKVSIIIEPIKESLDRFYRMIYGKPLEAYSIEHKILKELDKLKEVLTLKDALLFRNLYGQFDYYFASKEQKLWRKFVFCHLVFLFRKAVLLCDVWLLTLICDAITKENIEDALYLRVLSDRIWMKKVYEYVLLVDFSSSLTHQYQLEYERIKRVFLFMCRRIEQSVKKYSDEEFCVLKIELLKEIKSYQSNKLFKRSVSL